MSPVFRRESEYPFNSANTLVSVLMINAQGIMLVWDEETDGIEIVQTSTVKSRHDDAWFTLDGRQLSGKPTAKGLYIVNGKKVIIK